jgi:CBS domain-containing protein
MNFTPNLVPTKRKHLKPSERRNYEMVTKYMVPVSRLITFRPDQTIREVIDTLLKNQISGALVLNSKKEILGMVSERNCLKTVIDNNYHNMALTNRMVSDYMTTGIDSMYDDTTVVDAANKFLSMNHRRLPIVTREGKLIGQVSRRDILRAAAHIETTTW